MLQGRVKRKKKKILKKILEEKWRVFKVQMLQGKVKRKILKEILEEKMKN